MLSTYVAENNIEPRSNLMGRASHLTFTLENDDLRAIEEEKRYRRLGETKSTIQTNHVFRARHKSAACFVKTYDLLKLIVTVNRSYFTWFDVGAYVAQIRRVGC